MNPSRKKEEIEWTPPPGNCGGTADASLLARRLLRISRALLYNQAEMAACPRDGTRLSREKMRRLREKETALLAMEKELYEALRGGGF